MLGTEHLTVPVRIAAVVVPVAVYFLILGLLNSRRRPQLLTGRRDFALLTIALSPLFVLPALSYFGVSPITVFLAVATVVGCIWLLAPCGQMWVIYNIPLAQATDAVQQALLALGLEIRRMEHGFRLVGHDATVEIGGFSLLRNVSVRLRSCGDGNVSKLAGQLEQQLSQTIAGVHVEVSPMAVALLLVATGMLVAPLTLVAQRAGEIVRILTDLLH